MEFYKRQIRIFFRSKDSRILQIFSFKINLKSKLIFAL